MFTQAQQINFDRITALLQDPLEREDVATKVDSDGNYIRTPWSLCGEIVSEIARASARIVSRDPEDAYLYEDALKDKKVLVVDTVEFIPVLLAFGVNKRNITFVAPYNFKGKIASALGAQVVQESLLTWKTNMKFDVVVGNPPYQDGKDQYFYKGFVEKSFGLTDGVVAMITSANWVSGTGKSKKFFKQIIDKKITHYRYLGTKAFEVQILTAYFICQPISNSTDVLIISDSGTATVSRQDFGIVSSGVTDTLSIVSKVKILSKDEFVNFSAGDLARDKAVISTQGSKAIFGCGREGGDFDWNFVSNPEKLDGFGEHKVVFSKNSSIGNIGPIKYADPTFGCAANAYFIKVVSKTVANNLISYLKSKIIKISIKTLKHASCTNSKGLLNQLPAIDFTRTWTDAELYAHFNLTQEEIDYIEATIK